MKNISNVRNKLYEKHDESFGKMSARIGKNSDKILGTYFGNFARIESK